MTQVDPALLPELPVPAMHSDHVFEMRLVNELEVALAAQARGEGTLGEIVERMSLLAVHTREHFLREETMMREVRFPGYAAHKAEHDRVLAEMDAEARAFRARGDAERLSRFLFDALPRWYVDHTRTMDLAAARFVAGRGGQRP
jgi:hemerythrin